MFALYLLYHRVNNYDDCSLGYGKGYKVISYKGKVRIPMTSVHLPSLGREPEGG